MPSQRVFRQPDTEELQRIRSGVRQLCQGFPPKYWRELDARSEYPYDFVSEFTAAGYVAAMIPEEHGGSGLGVTEASIILEEVNRSGGNAAVCHAQMYTMGTLLRHGTREQKETYLPAIARGELRLQAFGVTEPDVGSDTTSIRTMAHRDGEKYVIAGKKVWTSRAQQSDLMLLLARTAPQDATNRTAGISVFLVDLRNAVGNGITIRPVETMVNHHTNEVFIDNLEVPKTSLIGEEGEGFKYILDGMNAERILIAAECIGDGDWFVDQATRYARDRHVFGRAIGANQGIQFPIASAYAHLRAADLMRFDAAQRFDAGEPVGPEANMAKLLAADASWEAANAAIQTFGGYGFAREYDVERKFRETRLYQVAPISTNLILAYLAHKVLDLPKSY